MSLDCRLFELINGLAGRSTFLDWVMLEFSREGNLLVPVVLLTAYWAWSNWPEARLGAPTLGVLVGFSDFLGAQLKLLIQRPRPCQVYVRIHELVGCGGSFSMPSNHALNSATAAAFLSALYPMTGWVTWPVVGMIGLSRVYLGAHYVSDVLAGWLLGGLLGGGVGWLVRRRLRFGRIGRPGSS